MCTPLSRFLLVAAAFISAEAAGDESADREACYETVPMPEDERQRITLSLLERYPQLASSLGVKAAYTSPSCPGVTSGTSVIYHPHSDNHGVKEAFEAHCSRTYPETTWTCDDVKIRRYLRLANQDFEVRLTASEITADTALALIEATRRDLEALVDATDRPDTVIIVVPHHDLGDVSVSQVETPEGSLNVAVLGSPTKVQDAEIVGYRVTWGTPDGYSRLTMLATLTKGGDPVNPDDWHASVFKAPVQQ